MTDMSQKDHELITRFLAGRLTDEEQFMLETRIVQDARFRREVDLTAALRDGMRELEARGEINRLLGAPPSRWYRSNIAVAASLGALVIGALSVTYLVDRAGVRRDGPTTVALHFERTRGAPADDAVTWEIGDSPTRLMLHFDVGATPATCYRVVVLRDTQDSAGREVTSSQAPSSEGEVVLTLDDSLLSEGEFEIRLSPVPQAAVADTTVYRLVVTDP